MCAPPAPRNYEANQLTVMRRIRAQDEMQVLVQPAVAAISEAVANGILPHVLIGSTFTQRSRTTHSVPLQSAAASASMQSAAASTNLSHSGGSGMGSIMQHGESIVTPSPHRAAAMKGAACGPRVVVGVAAAVASAAHLQLSGGTEFPFSAIVALHSLVFNDRKRAEQAVTAAAVSSVLQPWLQNISWPFGAEAAGIQRENLVAASAARALSASLPPREAARPLTSTELAQLRRVTAAAIDDTVARGTPMPPRRQQSPTTLLQPPAVIRCAAGGSLSAAVPASSAIGLVPTMSDARLLPTGVPKFQQYARVGRRSSTYWQESTQAITEEDRQLTGSDLVELSRLGQLRIVKAVLPLGTVFGRRSLYEATPKAGRKKKATPNGPARSAAAALSIVRAVQPTLAPAVPAALPAAAAVVPLASAPATQVAPAPPVQPALGPAVQMGGGKRRRSSNGRADL